MDDSKPRTKTRRRQGNVFPLPLKKLSNPELDPPEPERVELALAQMAARVSDAVAVPEAERGQLGILSDLIKSKAAFVSHFDPERGQLLVMSVRGRNDDRIAAATPGEGPIGKAWAEKAVVRDGALICAPLMVGARVVGCLSVLDPKVQVSDGLMTTLAAHLAAAFEVGRLRDEAVRRTRDLETALGGLKAIERSRDELLSNVSHDLKNPLATIKTWLSMMERGRIGELSEKQAHAVEVCQRNADRLSRLITDLVLISRLRAGEMQLDDKPFGLKSLCEERIVAAAPLSQQGQIDVDLRGGEVFVRGDRERLAEAVTQALEHAIFVTPRGGRVLIEVGTDDTGQARLSVTDQGAPIPEEELEHLFESFARSSRGPRRTDLGLSIAAKIVRLHGGRVHAKAHPIPESKASPLRVVPPAHRDSTTVEFLLPMYAGAVNPVELAQGPRSGGILLVEDDADCREVLQDVLEQEGYRVISSSSAAEARALLSNIRPALVLLDIHLRDEDGRTVLHEIRRNPSLAEVPVFVISGASNLDSLARQGGLDRIEGFLEKPIELSRLLDTVASAVHPKNVSTP